MPHISEAEVKTVRGLRAHGKRKLTLLRKVEKTIVCFVFFSTSNNAVVFVEIELEPRYFDDVHHPVFVVRVRYCAKRPNSPLSRADKNFIQHVYDGCVGVSLLKIERYV
jgi:hypothetical protein